MDTDEDIVNIGKKTCMEDLTSAIQEFLAGDPQELVRNMRDNIYCGRVGDLGPYTTKVDCRSSSSSDEMGFTKSRTSSSHGVSKGYFD